MTARRGQVALYLVVALVAICILVLMNVNIFLSVSAKNRTTNACDAAALAVAKHQGELINRIGNLNVRHLRYLVGLETTEGDVLAASAQIVQEQKRLCFLSPLEGLSIGSAAAKANGITQEPSGNMKRILEEHLQDIDAYSENLDMYPEPWEGAWKEYRAALQIQLRGEILAGPENPEFADDWASFPLVLQAFYNAIAGHQWCWFKFNGMWIFNCDSSNMPRPDFENPTPRWNCELYPLHLSFSPIGGSEACDKQAWAKMLAPLAGCTEEDIVTNRYIFSSDQEWAFYDAQWGKWSTGDDMWRAGFNPTAFPIVGEVKPEYDVLGCAAKCRVQVKVVDVLHETQGCSSSRIDYTSAAKPFGTVQNEAGEVDVVTANQNFVTSAFTDVRLVPTDSVGGANLDGGADYEWITHVRRHLRPYLENGPTPNGCWYCTQLIKWEQPAFRQMGVTWLKYHSDECAISDSSGSYTGGATHAH